MAGEQNDQQTSADQGATQATQSDQQTSQDQVTSESTEGATQATQSDQQTSQDQAGQQQVSDSETDASVEKNRAGLMTDFANVVGDYNQRIQTSFTAALSTFETITRSASAQDARADMLKVLVATAFDEGVKYAIEDLRKYATAAGVAADVVGKYATAAGVVFSYAKAINQEIDRAAAAAVSYDLATWIANVRSTASNAYVNSGSSQVLLNKIRDAYANLSSEDDKQSLIDNVTYATAAVQTGLPDASGAVQNKDWSVPSTAVYERCLYEAWTNGHFTVIGGVDDDISGFIDVRFEDGNMPKSTALITPLGDKVSDQLNNIASAAGLSTLMTLAVHKRVCRWADNPAGGSGWSCGWFDEANQLINEPNSDEVTNFLKSSDWQSNVTMFR